MFGLANRLVEPGTARDAAIALAKEIAAFPQRCMRSDRAAARENWSLDIGAAHANEFRRGMEVISSGETLAGARRFGAGEGRHGAFDAFKPVK